MSLEKDIDLAWGRAESLERFKYKNDREYFKAQMYGDWDTVNDYAKYAIDDVIMKDLRKRIKRIPFNEIKPDTLYNLWTYDKFSKKILCMEKAYAIVNKAGNITGLGVVGEDSLAYPMWEYKYDEDKKYYLRYIL